MVKKSDRTSCFAPACKKMGCCKVEALTGVDERRQMVLPKGDKGKKEIMAGNAAK